MIRAHHLRDRIHIAVIGGNGFIGRTLIKALSTQENLRIWSLDKRQHHIIIDTKGSKAIIEQVNMDVSTPSINSWLATRPMDMVVYLAGYESPTDGLGETVPDVNALKALVNTVNAFKSIRTPHEDDLRPYFLYVSSCSVYGENNIDVSSERDLLVPANYSGMGKMYCEDILSRMLNKLNVPWCVLRPTEVYGRKHHKELRDHSFWPGYLHYYLDGIVSRREAMEVFSPEAKVDLIHVNYLCEVIVDCLTKYRTGIYNVASGNHISIAELVGRIQTAYGEDSITKLLPSNNLKIEDMTITTGVIGEEVPYKHTKYPLNKFLDQYIPIRRLEVANDMAIESILSENRLLDTTATAAMEYFEKRKELRTIEYQKIREIAGPEQFKYIRYGRFQDRARELLGFEEVEKLEDLSAPAETLGDIFSIGHTPRIEIDLTEEEEEAKQKISQAKRGSK